MKISVSENFHIVSDDMFGGNLLANRDDISTTSTYSDLISDLGVTSLRYPGGSLTEYYFDINDPDQTTIADLTGNFNGDTSEKDFVALSDFMSFSAERGISVTIVIPTRTYLTTGVDENGDRFADIDEEVLRSFIQDVVSGEYGEASIDAFELGNEYWGSGEMSSVEYGRVASEMASIIDDELASLSLSIEDAEKIKILVQSGHNWGDAKLSDEYTDMTSTEVISELNDSYGLDLDSKALYSDGTVNWTYVSNKLVLSEFSENELEAVDGITPHLYTSDSEFEDEVSYITNQIDRTWGEEKPGIQIYVTEWNQNTSGYGLDRDEDYGLWQGQEILETFEEMVAAGVDGADIWPLLQNTANALSQGFEYETLTPAGEVFSLMAESLPGKALVETSDDQDHSDLYFYYGNDEAVMFIAADEDQTISLDLSDIMTEIGSVTAVKVGVSDQSEVGSSRAETVLTEFGNDDLVDGSSLKFDLQAGEVMQISIVDFEPTSEFQNVMDDVDTLLELAEDDDEPTDVDVPVDTEDPVDDVVDLPTVDPVDDEENSENEDDDGGGGDSGFGFLGFALLVPLALLGIA
ncbi:hypothetical protein [Thioclava sp. GXIMD4215]|uniref:hypothetical protein n=1 Tax=Thioclava sp. GXIMD4215 TaxID=3131928 RepID=UPI00324E71E9